MRTTLALDDDLAGLLKRRARELGVPFKEAVNRTIRAGLGETAAAAQRAPALKTAPHSFGLGPGIDADKLGQLADEPEAEAFVEKSMILPDVNVHVHAHNADSAVHEKARTWWDGCLAGSEGVGLAWAAMLGFVRITTNGKVVARPLPVGEVMERLQTWLALPHFHIAQPSDAHFVRLRAELERLGTAGNLTTGAHLAVLAMERGYVLHSTDSDFARFKELRRINPCRQISVGNVCLIRH